MKTSIFHRLWNWEVTPAWALSQPWVPVWAIITMVGYVLLEVVLLAPATVIGLGAYLDLRARAFQEPTSYDFTIEIFPWLFLILLGFNVLFRIYIGLEGYFFNRRTSLDRGQFLRNLLVYNPAAMLTLGLHFALALALALTLAAMGFSFKNGMDFVLQTGANLRLWIQGHIPTLIALPQKWMAAVVAVTLYSFTNYFEHWLSHKNRFLWHVVHGPHHLPDMLHPIGAPLAYNFEIFFIPIRVILGAALTKLVYAEPMLLESALFALANYNFEIFNHSSAHYRIAAKSKILRFIGKLGGGHGAYHYLHHSSAERHQMANLGAGLWMLWDRIFGTFVEPPLETPEVGWTGNPEVWHNPLRVVFGGPARIVYELRHNRSPKMWTRILFGSVFWNPPKTVDYLKKVPTQKNATLQHESPSCR
jgi:sterol desaturase/sphingolipid hydroxylase (fatty acid hydroxylase superfamily)